MYTRDTIPPPYLSPGPIISPFHRYYIQSFARFVYKLNCCIGKGKLSLSLTKALFQLLLAFFAKTSFKDNDFFLKLCETLEISPKVSCRAQTPPPPFNSR